MQAVFDIQYPKKGLFSKVHTIQESVEKYQQENEGKVSSRAAIDSKKLNIVPLKENNKKEEYKAYGGIDEVKSQMNQNVKVMKENTEKIDLMNEKGEDIMNETASFLAMAK